MSRKWKIKLGTRYTYDGDPVVKVFNVYMPDGRRCQLWASTIDAGFEVIRVTTEMLSASPRISAPPLGPNP